jgi:hypothetical protein
MKCVRDLARVDDKVMSVSPQVGKESRPFVGVVVCNQKKYPNKEYVESDDEIVYYTVEIYQNGDNSIVVNADSNTVLFDKMQYVLEFDKKISETDIDVEWTTIMGNPELTKDDQLAMAQVSISENGEIISQRKINFFKKGIEIIIDTINKK